MCAWCGETIPPSAATTGVMVTHGICEACYARMTQSVDSTVAARAAVPTDPACAGVGKERWTNP